MMDVQAVAFGGLFGSSFPILNQLSFFLCTAVLLDTFVVRTVLVPAIMSILGRFAWWPRKFVTPWSANGGPSACAVGVDAAGDGGLHSGLEAAGASGWRQLAADAHLPGPPRPIYVEVRHPRVLVDATGSHWVYEVCCLQKQQQEHGFELSDLKWSVLRRYSEFLALNEELREALGWQMPAVSLPPKQVFGSGGKAFVEGRRRALQTWLQAVVGVKNITNFSSHHGSPSLQRFLNYDGRYGGMVVRADDHAAATVADANLNAASEEGAWLLAVCCAGAGSVSFARAQRPRRIVVSRVDAHGGPLLDDGASWTMLA